MGKIICFKACQGTITYYFCFWTARVLQMVKNLVLYKASGGWYLRLALSFQSYCKFKCNTWCCASKQLWDNIFWFCSRGCNGWFVLWFYLWGRTILWIWRHWSMQWTLFFFILAAWCYSFFLTFHYFLPYSQQSLTCQFLQPPESPSVVRCH